MDDLDKEFGLPVNNARNIIPLVILPLLGVSIATFANWFLPDNSISHNLTTVATMGGAGAVGGFLLMLRG
jgi:hypothetical protein